MIRVPKKKRIDDLVFEPAILFFLGTRIITYIPNFVKYYDSFEFTPYGKTPALVDVPPLVELPRRERFLRLFSSIADSELGRRAERARQHVRAARRAVKEEFEIETIA